MSQVVGIPSNSYKHITNMAWVRARLCKLQKRCTRLTAASNKAYQLLAHGRWFSPGTPASSTTKTGRHDIAEILLKVALNTKNQIKSINQNILVLDQVLFDIQDICTALFRQNPSRQFKFADWPLLSLSGSQNPSVTNGGYPHPGTQSIIKIYWKI